MSKSTKMFICSHCDAQYQKWAGRCLECGQWGTVQEAATGEIAAKAKKDARVAGATKTLALNDIAAGGAKRIATGIGELDRVLGGGIVPGSLILLGGEPGIGKSTLALQLAAIVSPALYLSGEESAEQIKLQANRLFKTAPTFRLANETNVDALAAALGRRDPGVRHA